MCVGVDLLVLWSEHVSPHVLRASFPMQWCCEVLVSWDSVFTSRLMQTVWGWRWSVASLALAFAIGDIARRPSPDAGTLI